MYEHHTVPPLSRPEFFRRMLLHFAVATSLIAGSLGMGMAGYHVFEHLSWLDSFVNASMLLGGMGPVNTLQTRGGRIFAGCYALYSGLVFLVAVAILLAPVFHRIMHKLHWEEEGNE